MLNLTLKGEPKVCDIGGVKFGGQPGDYPCVCVNSIFQKGDKVFEGKRKEGFNEAKAFGWKPAFPGWPILWRTLGKNSRLISTLLLL